MTASIRALGRSGVPVSALALAGSYGIDADATVRAFHELGITTFFVTPGMKGLTEGLRRLVADGLRDRLTLISGASIPFGFSVRRELDRVARSLGVEAMDVFLLFWVQAHWYVTGHTWSELRKLKAGGSARALGISCHDRPMARSLTDELKLDVLMIRYNAAHRGAEREIFDTLDPSDRPGIVSYTATRWGKLLERAGGLGPMRAGECYRFALDQPMVDTVLTGAGSYEELRESAQIVAGGALSPSRVTEVKAFGDAVRRSATGRIGFLRA